MIPDAELDRAADIVRHSRRMAVLTGAGVSAESGVPTFRGANGLWEGRRIEEVATPEAFHENPGLVWKFYHQRRANLRDIQPNPGHRALVDLETSVFSQGRFTLITQNVDGLHRAAGSRRVFEIHGNLRFTRCTSCDVREDQRLDALAERPRCTHCGGWLRPDIVWFNEMLPQEAWKASMEAVESCDVFLVIGTSAVVFPAAGLIPMAQAAGARVIEINLAPTAASTQVDVSLLGPSGVLLPELVRRLDRHPS